MKFSKSLIFWPLVLAISLACSTEIRVKSETVVQRPIDTRIEDTSKTNGIESQQSWRREKLVDEYQYQLSGMVDRRSASGSHGSSSGPVDSLSLIEIKDKTDFGFKDQLQAHCSQRLEDKMRNLQGVRYVSRWNLEELKLDYQLSLAGLLIDKERMYNTYRRSGVKYFVFGYITAIGFDTNNRIYNFSKDFSWNLVQGVLSVFDEKGAPLATEIASSAIDTRRKAISLFVTMEFTVINLETGQIILARSYDLQNSQIMNLDRTILKKTTTKLLSQCIDLFAEDLREIVQ